jgi:hypothetical protein
MLWSQFLLIFGQKIGVFLENQCDDNFSAQIAVIWVNIAIFLQFFGETHFVVVRIKVVQSVVVLNVVVQNVVVLNVVVLNVVGKNVVVHNVVEQNV